MNPTHHLGTSYQESVNAYFQSRASYWRDIYRAQGVEATIYRERMATVLQLADDLQLPPGTGILEVGCGAGFATVELARRGFRVRALDSALAMITRTIRLAQDAGMESQISAQVGDVHALDFADGLFRLVLAVGVLPWVGPLEKPLQELARVTAPGGFLVLTIDNEWRLSHVLDPRCFPALRPVRRKARHTLERIGFLRSSPARPRHRLCSIAEFDRALLSSGLRKIRGTTIGFGPFTFLGWRILPRENEVGIHHYLQNLADRGFFALRSAGVEYIVLCQKPIVSRGNVEQGA